MDDTSGHNLPDGSYVACVRASWRQHGEISYLLGECTSLYDAHRRWSARQASAPTHLVTATLGQTSSAVKRMNYARSAWADPRAIYSVHWQVRAGGRRPVTHRRPVDRRTRLNGPDTDRWQAADCWLGSNTCWRVKAVQIAEDARQLCQSPCLLVVRRL